MKVRRGFMGKKCPNGKVRLVNKIFLAETPILTPKMLFKVSLLRRPIRDFALYFSHHLAGCQKKFFCLKIDVLSKKLCKIKIGSMVNKILSRHRITELFLFTIMASFWLWGVFLKPPLLSNCFYGKILKPNFLKNDDIIGKKFGLLWEMNDLKGNANILFYSPGRAKPYS